MKDSDIEQHGQNTSQASKGCNRKIEPWKAEEEKEEVDDDEEDEDTDFNPCLIAETASEASSSLSSEDEGSADSSQRQPLQHSDNQGEDAVDESENCSRLLWASGEMSHVKLIREGEQDIVMETRDKKSPGNKESTKGAVSTDETIVSEVTTKKGFPEQTMVSSPNPKSCSRSHREIDDEDAICMRTRARHSLADYSLEELETFLQESDDDDDLQNVDDEEEYRKFLSAVLSDGNDLGNERNGDENLDEDEENDADFEIEIEEALDSDVMKTIKRFQRASTMNKNRPLGQAKTPLRPILPFVTNTPVDSPFQSHGWQSSFSQIIPHSSSKVESVFSLSAHDPIRQHIASKVQLLLLEMVDKREEALACRRVSYPAYCFDYLHAYQSINIDPSQRINFSWAPSISTPMLSILDVKSLGSTKKYIDDLFLGIKGTKWKPKKSLAATLVERTKKQSIALVPSDIASLAQTFHTLFNPLLFPHKPPPPPVANRVLFTDSEDGLLAMGLMEYNNDWGAIQQRFLPCKSKHQIFVRQKNRSSSKAPENPIKAVRRMKTSPLTADEKVLIAEGLKLFKHEWISVWRLFWRIATGTQKSYRKDESVNEKRRLYEAKRRKLKASTSEWKTTQAEYEFDDADQNTADENGDNEEEAYVHEAFLADNEQVGSEQSSYELNFSGIINRSMPSVEIPHPGDTHVSVRLPTVTDEHRESNRHINGFLRSSKLVSGQQLHGATSPQIITPSAASPSTYRMRKRKGAQVVKLAPELPPVNLPPSVRVISQSAFRSYHSMLPSSVVDKSSDNVLIPRLPQSFKTDTTRASAARCVSVLHKNGTKNSSGQDLRASEDHQTEESNCVSDIQMHPLLFQMADAELQLYRTKDRSSTVSLRADQQANINLFRPGQSDCVNECSVPQLQSKGLYLSRQTIDFHPLLQRTGDINNSSSVSHPGKQPTVSESPGSPMPGQQQIDSGQPTKSCAAQYDKDGGIDLDIHLYSATNEGRSTGGRGAVSPRTVDSRNASKSDVQKENWEHAHIPPLAQRVKSDAASVADKSVCSRETALGVDYESRTCSKSLMRNAFGAILSGHDIRQQVIDNRIDRPSPEIVMEQEELSDSEEESDDVQFECEEMDDSEGEDLDTESASKIERMMCRWCSPKHPRMCSSRTRKKCQLVSISGHNSYITVFRPGVCRAWHRMYPCSGAFFKSAPGSIEGAGFHMFSDVNPEIFCVSVSFSSGPWPSKSQGHLLMDLCRRNINGIPSTSRFGYIRWNINDIPSTSRYSDIHLISTKKLYRIKFTALIDIDIHLNPLEAKQPKPDTSSH
ncbi:unnamed protein product [Spirodela intermedia]|uniref:Uncharacterized protein n=1 Tax=Spirodela intermedia TaxID=51605 RepID=A0A7I8I8F9_SPIIN|nr:unnamed protein product [Spirodela intermedia]CAA6653925.1 unnamed protein product [Spirodela intermedia]